MKQENSTIDGKISKSQNALFRKIGDYVLTVFNDAKRGTLSACSWPSREAAFQRGKQFLENGTIQEFSENPQDFRHLFHARLGEMLDCIVKADASQMRNTLTYCLANSLRTDGSVDRMQIHNDHLQAKVIHPDRSDSLYFLRSGESENWGAKGYQAAVKQACEPLSWDNVFSRSSSLVTDGENMNSGAKMVCGYCVMKSAYNQAQICHF